MIRLEWTEEYSVHIAAVDEQHRTLLELLNALTEGIEKGTAREGMSALLRRLAIYTCEHFSSEERLFEQHAYPRAAEHVAEHRRLTDRVLEFQQRFEEGKVNVDLELLAFLRNWLRGHIQGSDRAFGAHVLAQSYRHRAVSA